MAGKKIMENAIILTDLEQENRVSFKQKVIPA